MISNYSEFIEALEKAGFSGAVGGNDEGVDVITRQILHLNPAANKDKIQKFING